jgi:hypothetical protein
MSRDPIRAVHSCKVKPDAAIVRKHNSRSPLDSRACRNPARPLLRISDGSNERTNVTVPCRSQQDRTPGLAEAQELGPECRRPGNCHICNRS